MLVQCVLDHSPWINHEAHCLSGSHTRPVRTGPFNSTAMLEAALPFEFLTGRPALQTEFLQYLEQTLTDIEEELSQANKVHMLSSDWIAIANTMHVRIRMSCV